MQFSCLIYISIHVYIILVDFKFVQIKKNTIKYCYIPICSDEEFNFRSEGSDYSRSSPERFTETDIFVIDIANSKLKHSLSENKILQ